MATVDLGKISLTVEDSWVKTKAYERLVLLSHNGQAYVSRVDNIGIEPGTDNTVWMLVSKRGESLYQMMVREGLFVGTEAEFLQQYQDTLQNCVDATNDSVEQQGNVATTMGNISTAEGLRVQAESGRVSAENGRVSAESTRVSQETDRQKAERLREQNTSAAITECSTATGLAEAATTAANTAKENADTATDNANDATEAANTATSNANDAATAANNAAAGITGQISALQAKDTELEEEDTAIKTQLSTAEQVTAAALVEDAKDIKALKKIIIDLINGKLYCNTLLAANYKCEGADMLVTSDVVPEKSPDRIGQIYIQKGVGAYIAVDSESVSDWKPITVE